MESDVALWGRSVGVAAAGVDDGGLYSPSPELPAHASNEPGEPWAGGYIMMRTCCLLAADLSSRGWHAL